MRTPQETAAFFIARWTQASRGVTWKHRVMPGTGNLTVMPIHPPSTTLRRRLLHANKKTYIITTPLNTHRAP